VYASLHRLTKEKAEELRELRLQEASKDELDRRDEVNVKRGVCPNDCSGHGTCDSSSRTCICFQYYTGTDCSLEERPLTSGIPQSGSVDTFSWKYYYLALQYRGNMNVELNQTSATGDCDIYVQVNDIPTRNSYYKRDISTKKQVAFPISDAASGTWYYGVYGFLACNFTLKVTKEGSCPNACSGHGDCLSGNCLCYSGYYGVDCSQAVTTLTINAAPVAGSVADSAWSYYRLVYSSSSSTDELTITLTQTTPAGDADIYVKFQENPTEYSYDYANITVRDVSTIKMLAPQAGTWFIGVHGFRGCNYTIQVTSAGECLNECSHHGTCNALVCACRTNYAGDYCQTRNSLLSNGESDTGFVSPSSWNYFSYQSNSVQNLEVFMRTQMGDCDLYAKQGQAPTRVSYDVSDVGTTSNFTMSIPDPGSNTWYFGVYGWSTCSFTITIVETNACLPGCNTHGQCISGTCICNDGWAGEACDQSSAVLLSNTVQSGTISGGRASWKYYTYTSHPNSTSVHVALKELETDGWLWVFVSRDIPTLREYDYADTETNTPTHRINIDLTQEAQFNTYHIGVYANPYSLSRDIPFKIIAWSPDF
jgi:hypothetical protein